MPTITLRSGVSRTVAALVAAVVFATGSLLMTGSAEADPRQFTSALIGVGSDTTQEVIGALAGENNNTDYTPLSTSVATGRLQIVSWKAIPPTSCITPRAPGATFSRPNGSTGGRRALSRAVDGGNFGTATCGGAKPVSGLVDFARSSAVGTTTGTALTYIPFARDALSYVYKTTGTAVALPDMTRAELTSVYTASVGTGTNIRGTNVVPCGINTSSGTYAFWLTAVGATASQENTATAHCNSIAPTRIEEHDSAALVAKANSLGGDNMYIVGHSAGTWIAQKNGVAPSRLGVGAEIGAISNNGSGTNLGSPVQGTAPNMTPNSSFYNDGTFGRFVYNVFDTNRVTGLGNAGLKAMFVGPTSLVCSAAAQATVNKYGFSSLGSGTGASDCGNTLTQRGLDAGANP
jgi:hypothetical protein